MEGAMGGIQQLSASWLSSPHCCGAQGCEEPRGSTPAMQTTISAWGPPSPGVGGQTPLTGDTHRVTALLSFLPCPKPPSPPLSVSSRASGYSPAGTNPLPPTPHAKHPAPTLHRNAHPGHEGAGEHVGTLELRDGLVWGKLGTPARLWRVSPAVSPQFPPCMKPVACGCACANPGPGCCFCLCPSSSSSSSSSPLCGCLPRPCGAVQGSGPPISPLVRSCWGQIW